MTSLLPAPRQQKPSRTKRLSAPAQTLSSQTQIAVRQQRLAQDDNIRQPPTEPETENNNDLMDFLSFDTAPTTATTTTNASNTQNGTDNPFAANNASSGLGNINENDMFDPFEDLFGATATANNNHTNNNNANTSGNHHNNNNNNTNNTNNNNNTSYLQASTIAQSKQARYSQPPQSGGGGARLAIHPNLMNKRDSTSVPDPFFDPQMWTNFEEEAEAEDAAPQSQAHAQQHRSTQIQPQTANNNAGGGGLQVRNNNARTTHAKSAVMTKAPITQTTNHTNAANTKAKSKSKSKTKTKTKAKATSKSKSKSKTSSSHNNSNGGKSSKKKRSSLPALGGADGASSTTTASEETNCLRELHRGSALLKYPRRSGFPHFKHIQLSSDNLRIQWFSKRKPLNQTCIWIKDIRDVVQGQDTEVFKKFHQKTLEKSSFSIVYGHKYNTLDVAAKSIDECEMWVRCIRKLVQLLKAHNNPSELKALTVLKCGIHFKDRNRPMSRDGSGNFMRANNSKTLKIDPMALKEIERDMESLHKTYSKVAVMSQKAPIMKSAEFPNISYVLSELEERIEELTYEVANIRDTELAKREVWRANVDLTAIQEKVEVITKYSSDRRTSNFF